MMPRWRMIPWTYDVSAQCDSSHYVVVNYFRLPLIIVHLVCCLLLLVEIVCAFDRGEITNQRRSVGRSRL